MVNTGSTPHKAGSCSGLTSKTRPIPEQQIPMALSEPVVFKQGFAWRYFNDMIIPT